MHQAGKRRGEEGESAGVDVDPPADDHGVRRQVGRGQGHRVEARLGDQLGPGPVTRAVAHLQPGSVVEEHDVPGSALNRAVGPAGTVGADLGRSGDQRDQLERAGDGPRDARGPRTANPPVMIPWTSTCSRTSDSTSVSQASGISVFSRKKSGRLTILRPPSSHHTRGMISDQVPLHTPFNAASTASDVLDGVDLSGREAVVTGGHGRLGREATRALAAAGASVTVAARDPERAAAAVDGLEGVRVEQLDLADPVSVGDFATRWLDSGRRLHMLVNNAAVLFSPELQRDARGRELAFSTSHLGHFQLTRALLPALRAAGGARVVTVTSGAARFGEIRWDDLDFATGYDPGAAYGQSKRANVLFTVELDRRYADKGIRAFAVHPGVIIGAGPHRPERLASYRAQGLVDGDGETVIDPVGGKKTVEQGAATIVFGAASPLLDGTGGVYLKDSDVAVVDDVQRPLTANSIPSDANSAMLDPDDAARLWALSEALLD